MLERRAARGAGRDRDGAGRDRVRARGKGRAARAQKASAERCRGRCRTRCAANSKQAAKDLARPRKEHRVAPRARKRIGISQEEFYATFKGAVADVQEAQGKLDAWEKINRELLLEKERIDLRRDEVLRQIDQAGRRAEEFRDATSLEDAVKPPRRAVFGNFADMEHRIFRLRGDLASIGEVDHALMKEAEDTDTRHEFLLKESEDLKKAVADLTALMHELNEKIKTRI